MNEKNNMKKSELRQVIREEIQNLNEEVNLNDFEIKEKTRIDLRGWGLYSSYDNRNIDLNPNVIKKIIEEEKMTDKDREYVLLEDGKILYRDSNPQIVKDVTYIRPK